LKYKKTVSPRRARPPHPHFQIDGHIKRPVHCQPPGLRPVLAAVHNGSRSPTPSGSVFLVHCLFITAAPLLASRSDTGLAPHPGSSRDPENVQCRAVTGSEQIIYYANGIQK